MTNTRSCVSLRNCTQGGLNNHKKNRTNVVGELSRLVNVRPEHSETKAKTETREYKIKTAIETETKKLL